MCSLEPNCSSGPCAVLPKPLATAVLTIQCVSLECVSVSSLENERAHHFSVFMHASLCGYSYLLLIGVRMLVAFSVFLGDLASFQA